MLLRDVPIQKTRVRPRENIQSANGLPMSNAVEYVVTDKGDRYVWLIESDHPVAEIYALSRIKQPGMYQCLASTEFFSSDEVRPHQSRQDRVVEKIKLEERAKRFSPTRIPGDALVEFDFTDEDEEIPKLSPQALTLVEVFKVAIKKERKKVFTEDEIKKIVSTAKSRIGGRQEPYRVWIFYRSKFAKMGLIRKER